MKKIMFKLIALILISTSINAQIQINNIIFPNGFGADTVTSISLKVVNLDVQLQSIEQRPTFYIAFLDKSGSIIKDRNINWEDLKVACTKKGYSESVHNSIIESTISATLCGTKTQKLGAIRNLLDVYGIIVKPDNMQ